MADQYTTTHQETTKFEEPCETPAPAVEASDRGLFGFGKKDEEKKCEEEVIATEFDEKVKVCEEEKVEEPKHESLLQKLHRSDSSSSSSSEEEYIDDNGEKKKKKKLKDKIKEKISGDKKEEEKAEVKCEDTVVPIEKCDDVPEAEKKGLLEKIKDKLPGGNKKTEEVVAPPPPVTETQPLAECYGEPAAAPVEPEKEKKGFLEKIKEKIPGYHPKTEEEKEKEKEKEAC
uniref:Dehydrin 1 n=1 Tax=Plantago major TaxID=29818 RepID=Q5ZF69_PLAMJ|nr:dehydrin 1 [Plantago major]